MFSFRRNGRSLKGNDENKQLDDINDFNSDTLINDDSSVLQKFHMMDEGNVTEEGRGKELNKAYKQGNKQGYNGAYDDDGIGYGYGSSYKGIASRFILFALSAMKIELFMLYILFLFSWQLKTLYYTSTHFTHSTRTHYSKTAAAGALKKEN